jgi:hypothetical protein
VTTSNSSTIANSHNLQFTTARIKSFQSAAFIVSLVMASNDVASSVSVFTSLLTADCLTTNSKLLRNDLQQWGLLRLPRVHQGRLSHNRLRLGLRCLPADYLYITNSLYSRLPCWLLLVKLLLDFASTVIPGFSLLEIHDQDFYSLSDMYVFRNGASSSPKKGPVFLCRRYACCTVVSARCHSKYNCSHSQSCS